MKYLVALLAWLMPLVAWLSNTGVFGPTNGQISDQYPTLIVASGYAFSIWGVIFLLDVIYGTWQLFERGVDARARALRPYTAIAFALTSAWMIVFSLQLFWLALVIIWVSLACLLYAAWRLSHSVRYAPAPWWQWVPLSLHAGWVSLAVFLDVAQVIVAFRLLPTGHMLPWTLALFVVLTLLLIGALVSMRGNPWYALAAMWGLAAVYVKQGASELPGALVAGWIALGLAVVVASLCVVLLWRWRRSTDASRMTGGRAT